MSDSPVTFDLEYLRRAVAGRRIAVVSTPGGWIPGLGCLPDFIGAWAEVRGFLALEHGLRGELQDGVRFETYIEARSGLPVFSLYGEDDALPSALFAEIDAVVFHAQDVSHRAYTFKDALARVLSAAAKAGKTVTILDRPSPLAHLGHRGPLCRQFFPLPLPILTAATLGELGRWLRDRTDLDVDLEVIPVQGWRRDRPWTATGLPWVPPSPNIPTLASAYAYACTGALQYTSVSEGRGTCKPFEYVGAPFLEAPRLLAALNARSLPGVVFREIHFQPAFNKYAGQVCAGIHLIIADSRRLQPVTTLLTILQELARLQPQAFALRAGFERWLDGEPWDVEKLRALEVRDYVAGLRAALDEFEEDFATARLY